MSYPKTLLLFFICAMCGLAAAQIADHPVIAEVYGGGGNSGSYFKYDYIVLYNPSSNSIDVSTWSVQYASAASASWKSTILEGNINGSSYYVIQLKGGTKGGEELPMTPDVIGSTSLATTSGKVALVSGQDELTVNNPVGEAGVIDFVGYGSADAFEGEEAAPSPSNIESIRRLDNNGEQTLGTAGSGYDSDENSADFFIALSDGANPPLPVELISFNISATEGTVFLTWETATEVNNYGFEIQRTSPRPYPYKGEGVFASRDWERIGFVKGSGNCNSANKYLFKDEEIVIGREYTYRLKQIDTDGRYCYSPEIKISTGVPADFKLFQNYPNPFNPVTTISYELPRTGYVELKIYNILGRELFKIVEEVQEAGRHRVEFNGNSLASGIYFYRLKSENFTATKMMSLIK